MPDEILIAGLGTVGSSIARSLRHAKLAVGLVGYDPQPKVARAALKALVVDRLIGDLDELPAECDLSILSLPPGEMIPALERLAPRLGEGVLVLSTSPVQSPIMAWCAEHLPAGRSYVGAVPVEGGSVVAAEPEAASEPVGFAGGVMALVMPRGTPQSAIDVAASSARIMGARAFFLDPAELDAATAATDGLPILLAAALMNMSTRQPGWRDARRLTGSAFTRGTALLADLDPQQVADSLNLNRASLSAKLDALTLRTRRVASRTGVRRGQSAHTPDLGCGAGSRRLDPCPAQGRLGGGGDAPGPARRRPESAGANVRAGEKGQDRTRMNMRPGDVVVTRPSNAVCLPRGHRVPPPAQPAGTVGRGLVP